MDFSHPETWTEEQRGRFRVVQKYEATLREKHADLYAYYLKFEIEDGVLPHSLGIQLTNILEKDFSIGGVLRTAYFLTFRQYTEYQHNMRQSIDD
ncbi:hypothetical protein [Aureimonas altamirensis]|uniref:hypothetical protein n=1 Tax=Aureimonas altamirensis TaxID=370622 RepID=UPI0012E0B154|nr:hypothetical protein [Aureimonas altamirensis]